MGSSIVWRVQGKGSRVSQISVEPKTLTLAARLQSPALHPVSDDKPSKPSPVGDVLARVLADAGIAERVSQAGVVPEWPSLVGPAVAGVTEPLLITSDGTLFVAVTTNAWMTELSLMEPELLRAINQRSDRPPVRKIRWQLKR